MQIVTKTNRTLTLNLAHLEDSAIASHSRGQLVVHAEECISSRTTTEMILRCSDLEHKDLFSRIVWFKVYFSLFFFLHFFCLLSRYMMRSIFDGLMVLYLQNPFLVISKTVENGNPIPVCKTEVLKNDHSPVWKPVFLNIQQVGSKVKRCYFWGYKMCIIK